MRIDIDVPIPMQDGVVLRADVFRPVGEGRCPVIMSYGPYGKGLAFQEGYKGNWTRMIAAYPEIAEGTSNKYQNWELVDPEKWVPDGYACLRIDSRGAGRSPGALDVWSPREAQDMVECIAWAASQPWSNGKVGINGISYYAMNQWHVAGLRPPGLAAMAVWEGAADYYRDPRAPWRDSLRLPGHLVQAPSHVGAARGRRSWPAQPGDRRRRCRAADARRR